LLIVLLASACSGKASDTQCEAVADHMLDLATTPPVPPGETPPPPPAPGSSAAKALEAEKKRFLGNASAREHLVTRCKKGMPSSRAECILAASSEADLAKCGR
jgi:hypothetical protein